ncbi:hypothetical protein MYX77_12355 [Acidobacteriia bacterium AH_259_A11_L15]|nr:hypothetical protein [Acidobacteriia bacterium AH_259_A11_L15]
MPRTIQMGQIWRNDTSGENFLVTKVYQEVFSTFAVLRKVGDETSGTLRVKVQKSADGMGLPGYSFTQEEE